MALYHYVYYYCYYNYYYIRRRPDTVVQFEHSSRCHICAVLCYLTFSRPIRLLRFACSWPLRANMTLSIKPEVHSVSQRRRMRTEPPLEVMDYYNHDSATTRYTRCVRFERDSSTIQHPTRSYVLSSNNEHVNSFALL